MSMSTNSGGRCRELLTRFLGIPPNVKTQALYHSVRERAVSGDVLQSFRPAAFFARAVYCPDLATCSVSIRNFATAACATVADSAVVGSTATDGSALPSAVA